MPELPEVQTVINYLKTKILNCKINEVIVNKDKFLKNTSRDEFKSILKNKTIENISRKGKYLIFHLSQSWFMISHLRMEGKFFVDDRIKNRKHDYIIFKLTNNKYLTYNDSRQFGTFHLSKDLTSLKEINKIAIDPLDPNFTFEFLKPLISNSKKNIKAILLDQTMVSGIGNIYASEILFDALVNPFKKGCELNDKEIEKIFLSSKKILNLALEKNGTTIHTFSFGNNVSGSFLDYLKVVGKTNQQCPNCKKKITRKVQQSRSTFYCQNCQK